MAGLQPFTEGYVVLTMQSDGTWRDDWDGEVHIVADDAVRSYREAVDAIGGEHALLCKVTPIREDD